MGPIWGRQDPGGPHVGPMNFAIWEVIACRQFEVEIHHSWKRRLLRAKLFVQTL